MLIPKTKKRMEIMKTMMAPSDVSSAVFDESSATDDGEPQGAKVLPIPVDDEPNLYRIPSSVYPTYRPLPFLLSLGSIMVSFWASAVQVFGRGLTWLTPFLALKEKQWKTLIQFMARGILLALTSQILFQEVLAPPSRLSIRELLQNYHLPSRLSRYEQVTTIGGGGVEKHSTTGCVHYLELKASPPPPTSSHPLDAIYVNHGFGASSLSWLPAIPKLLKKGRAKVVLGHDSPGFGFTDRPSNLEEYTLPESAKLGAAILQKHLDTNLNSTKVALLGHSMGCATTLHMALQLPQDATKYIILCAPALGLRDSSKTTTQGKTKSSTSIIQKSLQNIKSLLRRFWLVPTASYVLRRVVGLQNFWRNGLKAAWGDPEKLSASDVLRFQWPSIGKGWERGLLDFASAQGMPSAMTDSELVERVLAQSTAAKILVIYGSKDRVVSPNSVRSFFEPYRSRVKLVEIEGSGHDPFEEDTDRFVEIVEEALLDWRKQNIP